MTPESQYSHIRVPDIKDPFSAREFFYRLIRSPDFTLEAARETVRFLMVNFPDEYEEGISKSQMGPVVRVESWLAQNADNTEKVALINRSIVEEIKDQTEYKGIANEKVKLKYRLSMAQLAGVQNLDDQVRNDLWQWGEEEEDSKDKARLLGFCVVVQPKDGSWKPRWLNYWESNDHNFWPVAFSGLINVDPKEATILIPQLFGRQDIIPNGSSRIAFLMFRLFQYVGELDFVGVLKQWEKDGYSGEKILTDIKAVWAQEYPDQVPQNVLDGLSKLEAAL